MATLIDVLNLLGGAVLAAFLGATAARVRPDLARLAGGALAGHLGGVALALLAAAPMEPWPAVLLLAFLAAAWAAAPLDGVRDRRREALAAAAGAGAALFLAVLSALALFWVVPFVGLVGGLALVLLRSRPDEPGEPEGGGEPPG